MNDKIAKIKQHVIDNKAAYIVGAIGVAAVAACAVIIYKQGEVMDRQGDLIEDLATKLSVSNAPTSTIGDVKDSTVTIDQSLSIFIDEALGDSGDVIRNIATGMVYRSRGEFSRMTGHSMRAIGKYFKGELSDLGGQQFEIVGKAESLVA